MFCFCFVHLIFYFSAEDFCAFSLPDDRMVEVQGEPAGVHKAVELIAGQLRKFLVDRTVLPLFETYHVSDILNAFTIVVCLLISCLFITFSFALV